MKSFCFEDVEISNSDKAERQNFLIWSCDMKKNLQAMGGVVVLVIKGTVIGPNAEN